jgi:murein DD-endopeptidase MepM/ murein hydrolase activator NlpD
MSRDWLYLLGLWILTRSNAMNTSLESTPLRWPLVDDAGVKVGAITQEFKTGLHLGVDVSIPGQLKTGKANVRAIAAGQVVRAYLAHRGWAVLIDHGDWASGYLHLASVRPRIVERAHVDAGEVLGPMGADPLDEEHVVHLHLQIAPGGNVTDPAPYLARAV